MDHVSIGALLFLSAGTLDWHQGWIFMAEFVIGGLAVTLWLAWRDPGLLKERMGGPFQKGQAFWGQGIMALCRVRTLQANPRSVVNLSAAGQSASRQIP